METGAGVGGLNTPPALTPDTISGMASHLNYSNSADGQNQGGSGSHDVSTVWYNSSVIGDKIEGLSESQINDELSKGIGLGDYSIEISVASQHAGSRQVVKTQILEKLSPTQFNSSFLITRFHPMLKLKTSEVWNGELASLSCLGRCSNTKA